MLQCKSWGDIESEDGAVTLHRGLVGPSPPLPAGHSAKYSGLASGPRRFRSWFNKLVICKITCTHCAPTLSLFSISTQAPLT